MGMPARTHWRSVCIAAIFSVLLVTSVVFAGTAAGLGDGSPTVDSSQTNVADRPALSTSTIQSQNTLLYQDPDADVTVTRVELAENGSAVWELTVRTRLESESEVEEYEAFQEEFRANRSQYVGEFENRMRGVVDNAQVATGREMTAGSFQSETGIQEVPRQWGYVTYRFSWDGLAATDGDSIAVGDVFEGGYFLQEDDILVIMYPDGYEPEAVTPTADESESGELQWNGPTEFEDQRPSVQFEATSTGDADQEGSTPVGTNDDDGFLGTAAPVVLMILLMFTAVGVYVYRSNHLPDTLTDAELTGTDGPSTGSGQPPTDGPANDSTTGNDAAPQQKATTAASGRADTTESDQPADPPSDEFGLGTLATDEDRVIALLESEDGRMRQAAIGDYFDWSDSKTSRVLSQMNADGQVEKLRIGRENVIDLPETDNQSEE